MHWFYLPLSSETRRPAAANAHRYSDCLWCSRGDCDKLGMFFLFAIFVFLSQVLLIRLATLGTELKEDRGCWQHSVACPQISSSTKGPMSERFRSSPSESKAPFEVWRLWLLAAWQHLWKYTQTGRSSGQAPLKYLNRLALAAFGFWPGCIKVNDLRKA